ncbi:MAG: sodium-dependent transporter [Paludibacteraceae bacterium]|nr:sodium-dependent transporter [Paludibacteraceae bacterium]
MASESTKNNSFTSKVGLIMAAAGSAVGLGNIWKFPYIAGENGGGAFLIVYLICVVLFGLPLLMTEFLIGKRSGKSAFSAFRELNGNGRWQWLSWLCMLTAVLIMGFYFIVTGWCFNYLFEALRNTFNGLGTEALTAHFSAVVSNTPRMIGFSVLPVVLTAAVLWFDVNKGIERLSKILMPLLLLMMLLMAGRVLMLDGSNEGMRFFFQTDFSKITPRVVMEAMGQCFFSLSIGMGALITYGAYMPKSQNVTMTSLQVITLDTLVAILAGVIIFPAVFSFGFDPAEGPQLVFVVLPAILEQMSFSWFSSVLFFALLCIAALTSTISLMEVMVAFICDASSSLGSRKDGQPRRSLNRHQSVLIASAVVMVLIVLCTLSMTGQADWLTIMGHNLFDCFDEMTACVMMPLGALGMSLFVGWSLPKNGTKGVLYADRGIKRWFGKLFIAALRWFVPAAIIVIFLNSLGII